MTPEEERIYRAVLAKWQDEAAIGKPADFRQWSFFDTNCLSELVKLAEGGNAERVSEFVQGRDVLISSTNLQELRHVPQLAQRIPDIFRKAKLSLVPDLTKFWDADLYNFFNIGGHPRNVLETYPLPTGVFAELDKHPKFIEVCERSEQELWQGFRDRVAPDFASKLSEAELGAAIWHKISAYSEESPYSRAIPPADGRYENFPAFYTFHYTYYFRYMKSDTSKVDPNDFNDLLHSIAAPYCTLMCIEKSFGKLLRNEIQGRVPATPYSIAKKLHKKGHVDPKVLRNASTSQAMRKASEGMLPAVEILTMSEMRSRVLGREGETANDG
jgi:hypothetical protein